MNVRGPTSSCPSRVLRTAAATPGFSSSRLVDPVDGVAPKPKRIVVQDVKMEISTMATIAEHRRTFVPGLAGGRVVGHRHVRTTAKTSKNHGGKREKKEWGDNFPIHKDRRSLLDDSEQDVTGQFPPRHTNSPTVWRSLHLSPLG